MTEEERGQKLQAGQLWFPVPSARQMVPAEGHHFEWLQTAGWADNRGAFKRLQKLVTTIHVVPTVSHFQEKSDDLDRILNIFIRVNSGGTQLSFSDLLLSLAISQWSELDARQEINSLQDQVNATGQGYTFGRDRLLKAALVLGDFDNIKFRADNFKKSKMSVIEEGWPDVKNAVLVAVKLIDKLGFSAKTFRAENALIPIAYFIQNRELDEKLLTSNEHANTRRLIHRWLAGSFLRSGYWTGAVDGILLASREAIKQSTGDFPFAEISTLAQGRTGKLLNYSAEDVDELLDEVKYGSWRAVLCLQLIFGDLDSSSTASIDHLHPRSDFSTRRGQQRGWSAEQIADRSSRKDLLPNLQLMTLLPNQEKSSTALDEWLENSFGVEDRSNRKTTYLLDDLPLSVDDFDDFYDGRRRLMRERLISALCN